MNRSMKSLAWAGVLLCAMAATGAGAWSLLPPTARVRAQTAELSAALLLLAAPALCYLTGRLAWRLANRPPGRRAASAQRNAKQIALADHFLGVNAAMRDSAQQMAASASRLDGPAFAVLWETSYRPAAARLLGMSRQHPVEHLPCPRARALVRAAQHQFQRVQSAAGAYARTSVRLTARAAHGSDARQPLATANTQWRRRLDTRSASLDALTHACGEALALAR